MNDYTDLIYLMAAMLIFSILSMQVNGSIFRNNVIQMQSGIEYKAITHAQDYADQIQWLRSVNELDAFANAFPRTDEVIFDEDEEMTLPFLVDIVVADTVLQDSNVINKHVTINVRSVYLDNQNNPSFVSDGITTEFIKNFN